MSPRQIGSSILTHGPYLVLVRNVSAKRFSGRYDPLSNYAWPLDYHRDIKLVRADGSDVRVLWELNRLGHFLTLARAYSLTNDERYAAEFFAQLRNWAAQNPYGRGPNWACAMEVALRAMNLLAAFEIFRHSLLRDSTFCSSSCDYFNSTATTSGVISSFPTSPPAITTFQT